jgi:hypothetical protein
MLKPITQEEKLAFTLELQLEKATDELLGELFYKEEYDGFVDIWWKIKTDRKKLTVVIGKEKVLLANSAPKHKNYTRYQVIKNKGIRVVESK